MIILKIIEFLTFTRVLLFTKKKKKHIEVAHTDFYEI